MSMNLLTSTDTINDSIEWLALVTSPPHDAGGARTESGHFIASLITRSLWVAATRLTASSIDDHRITIVTRSTP